MAYLYVIYNIFFLNIVYVFMRNQYSLKISILMFQCRCTINIGILLKKKILYITYKKMNHLELLRNYNVKDYRYVCILYRLKSSDNNM